MSSLKAEINALPDVKVRVDTVVSGKGDEISPWQFRITFLAYNSHGYLVEPGL